MEQWRRELYHSELYHYGVKHRSGRYPYGSGDRPYQDVEGGFSRSEKREAKKLNKYRKKEIDRVSKRTAKDLRRLDKESAKAYKKFSKAEDKGDAKKFVKYGAEYNDKERRKSFSAVAGAMEITKLESMKLDELKADKLSKGEKYVKAAKERGAGVPLKAAKTKAEAQQTIERIGLKNATSEYDSSQFRATTSANVRRINEGKVNPSSMKPGDRDRLLDDVDRYRSWVSVMPGREYEKEKTRIDKAMKKFNSTRQEPKVSNAARINTMYTHGSSVAEIAKATGIPASHVKMMLPKYDNTGTKIKDKK